MEETSPFAGHLEWSDNATSTDKIVGKRNFLMQTSGELAVIFVNMAISGKLAGLPIEASFLQRSQRFLITEG